MFLQLSQSMYALSVAFFETLLFSLFVPAQLVGKAVILSLRCWSMLKHLQELRRLFKTSTLQWDAENFGGQSLMEVALERQTLGIAAWDTVPWLFGHQEYDK